MTHSSFSSEFWLFSTYVFLFSHKVSGCHGENQGCRLLFPPATDHSFIELQHSIHFHTQRQIFAKMKYIALSILAIVTTAAAFVPAQQQNSRVSTEQAALADKIFGLDLFAPNPEINTYGARNKKNVSAEPQWWLWWLGVR